MSNLINSQLEERAFELGKDEGYEECMKEWLGMLRFHLNSIEVRLTNDDARLDPVLDLELKAKKQYIEQLIKLRW